MRFIFYDPAARSELILPVTPPSFTTSFGTRIETINIHALGDAALAGYSTLSSPKIECLLPAHDYPFNQPSAVLDPYYYIRRFEAWKNARTILRWIVSGTPVNISVKIENVSYGEQDGTRDVYATISLREFRTLAAVEIQSASASMARTSETAAAVTQDSYTVVYGDTLSAIARKFYGDAALYAKLAAYNGIKNANIIQVGQIIKLPDKSLL